MNRFWLPIVTAFSLSGAGAFAQEQVVRLYDGKAPGSENWTQSEKENDHNSWNTRVVYDVADPTLTVFKPDPAARPWIFSVRCERDRPVEPVRWPLTL